MNNPFWRYDAYVIEGEFRGATCRVTVNGRPVARSTAYGGDSVYVTVDAASGIGLPDSVVLLGEACNGVLVSIVAPRRDSLPRSGVYRATLEFPPRRYAASVSLSSSGVGAGWWPFAATGVYLTAYDGVVQLDSMSRSRVWARFKVRARREHNGE